MSNFTFEDYKKAIKAKYEEENSFNFSSPTTANLRNLCVKRFKSNNNREDLNAFESFFEFPFDKDKKNLFGEDEMNKLEAVKRFFLGKTERPAEDTIQLAAILVDLQPRSFRDFKKQHEEDEQKLIDELKNKVPSDILIDEVERESSSEANDTSNIKESETIQGDESESEPESTSNGTEEKPKSKIFRYSAILGVLSGLVAIIYLALPKKDCMQWSGDHYEKVTCDRKVQGIGTFNLPELYDERIIDLRRIKVCDTTTFFINEKAIVWYTKVGDSVEFFNTHGVHPENGKALRPVTHYIIDKYVRKH